MRDFEKISFDEFSKRIKNDRGLYDNFPLPARGSKNAAGYDFFLLEDIEIKPGEIIKIPTGVKSYFETDEVLFLIVRSSTGFKYNIRLVNQVGVIDSDYYNNADNEGQIFYKVQNEGDKTVSFKKGETIVQGIFVKYLTTKSDNNLNAIRGAKY